MKILLTGGTGFIGAPLSRELKQRGHDFTLAVYGHDPQLPLLEKEFNIITVNLLNEASRTELMRRVQPDMLIHLAWYAEPNNFWQSPLNLDWLYASLDLFKHFGEHGGARCLMTGTCAEYDWRMGGCFSEKTTPLAPSTFYGIAKDALRRACEGYASICGISLLWCRLFWPYGPGEPNNRFFSSLMRDIRDGKTAICRAGNLKRDYMHVDDIAEALIAAAFSRETGAMNIASGQSVSLGMLAHMLAQSMGKKNFLQVETAPVGLGSPLDIYADISRLKSIHQRETKTFQDGILSLISDGL